MLRKIFLSILFLLISAGCLTLIYIYNIDYDDLGLFYSVYSDSLHIYSPNDDLIGEFSCVGECFLAYSVNENVLDNYTLTYESKMAINITIPVIGTYAFIVDDEVLYYVNLSSDEVISEYRSIKYLGDNFVALKDSDNKYALASLTSDGLVFISDFVYSYIGKSDYSSNFLVKSDDYFLVDENGVQVSDNFSVVFNYTDENVVVKLNGYYYLYNYESENVLGDAFSMIKLDENFVYVVVNNLLFIYNSEYEKISDDAINLGTVVNFSSYYVYSEKHEFLYADGVFTTEYDNDILNVYANDEVFVLNVK